MKSLRLLTIPLLVLLLAGIAAAQSPAAFSLIIHPREAVLNHGQGIKFEAQIFSVAGLPVPVPKYTWRVEPDSLGRITDDGFFIAGRQDGEATIVCIAEFGMPMIRLIGKAHVVIGRPSDPPIKVVVVPQNAVVPPGESQQYHAFIAATNRHLSISHIKWLVEPRHLGEISPDGLFKAGPEVGQGHIIALVEIEGAVYRGVARVTVAQKPSGIISGQVVDQQTGLPLQKGGVWAELIGPIEWRVDARVDSLGNYVLRHLIPGLYVLMADAKDYLPEFYDNVAHFDEATPVQVAAHDSIPGINFSLSMGGSIAGFIGTDGDSGAIAGAHVVAIHVVDPRKSRHAVADENGEYKITALATGSYAVAADAPGYKGEFYDDAKNLVEADLISIVEPEAETGIDLYLATGSAIAGNVSSSAGDPLEKALVRLQALIGDRPHFFKEVLTDENGNYIASVLPGFYLVHASARGYLGEYYDNVRDYHDATPVQVFENTHTEGIDFVLNPLSTISGKVVDAATNKPIVGAPVSAFPEMSVIHDPMRPAMEARYPLVAKTDSLGNYVIENVKPGKYYVRAEARGYLPEFWQEAEHLSDATLIEITESTSASGIDFTLDFGGAISGNVYTAEDSSALQGAVVKIWSITGNAIHRAVTDENGHYRLSGLRTGDYYVHAAAQGYEGLFYDGVKNREDATLVHVEAPNETKGIDFYLPKFQSRLGSIAGVITADADGAPIPHAFVLAIPIVPGQAHFDLTDPFGFYRINGLPPGNYVVLAWAPGYVGEFYDNVRNWAQATPVTVVANTETGDINFGLATSPRGPYRIAGRLRRAATNAPVANGVIYAFTADGQVASTVTNADGSYALDEMPAGSYKIMASTSESPTAFYGGTNAENASSVEVGNGQSAENVDFNIEGTTGVDDTEGVIPSTYGLEQNYPNPFNPETTIRYQLAGKSEVSLKVYNLLGQDVATLVNTTQEPGVYRVQWNGTNQLGQKVATGVYLFQLKAGDFIMTRKMVMMR